MTFIQNILICNNEESEEEEGILPSNSKEAPDAMRLVSTYFGHHDINTSLQQQATYRK